jgi:hypothetical protein
MPTYCPLTPGPGRLTVTDVDVPGVSVIHADAARGELWGLERKFVHSRQRQTGHTHVCSQAFQMFAVRNSANLPVGSRAAITGMHQHGGVREAVQGFQAFEQARVDLQTAATATAQFLPRKMRTKSPMEHFSREAK